MAMKILTSMLTETVVYWGTPKPDGYGKTLTAMPVELDARWEDVQEMFLNDAGDEVLSQSVVYVSADVVVGGYLWRGELATLTALNITDHSQLVDQEDGSGRAYEIKQFGKLPTLKGDQYLRTVHL